MSGFVIFPVCGVWLISDETENMRGVTLSHCLETFTDLRYVGELSGNQKAADLDANLGDMSSIRKGLL